MVISELPGTQTTVQSSENPSNYGDLVTFTVNVIPAVLTDLVPTGTVTFYDGGTAIDTETLVNGSASFATSAFTAGTHTIVVQYSGDTNFSGGNSKSSGPGRQPGRQHDGRHADGQSLGLGPVGDLHGHRRLVGLGARHADRPGHLLRRHHGHRHRNARRWHGVLHDFGSCRGRRLDHRPVHRRYGFLRQHARRPSPRPSTRPARRRP